MTDTMPDFGPPDDYEPPGTKPFRLHGTDLSGEPWDEVFSICGEAPQGALTDLAGSVNIVNGNLMYSATATVRFMRAVIAPVDEVRFDALLADKNRPLPLEQLGQTMMWAAGIVADRPTGPQPPSPGGLRDDAPGSADGQPGQDDPAAG